MLDRALELAHEEMTAMENEAYEDAIELSKERGRITEEAWDFFDATVREEYRSRLLELGQVHKRLYTLAKEAHKRVQESLQSCKQEKRRMRGYQTAISHAIQ
ncbi:MAG: hypothetical protein J5803_05190 [Desulfovibrio sp.]|nr:hypothetical protein [Desulfovibrio sp.]